MNKIYLFLFIFVSACSSIYIGDELPNLKGKDKSEVMSILGKPVSWRQEADLKMWAYYQENCSTLIFFDSNDIVQYAERRGNCYSNEEKK